MKNEVLKNSQFYLDHSEWVENHDFDSEGRPLDKNRNLFKGTLRSGYPSICIKDNHGKYHRIYIHRMIALIFVPNPKNLKVVNHKNGNKEDYRISNLEWVSQKENVKHAYKNGLKNPPTKEIVADNKETNERVEFSSRKECGEYFKVKPCYISNYIRKGCLLKKEWKLSFKNEKDNERLSFEEFESLVSIGKIKEHPRYKGYYGYLENAQVISLKLGKPRILKPAKLPSGYFQLKLNSYEKTIKLHRFNMECNKGKEIPNGFQVDHVDSNPSNNVISNLQILSHVENTQKACNKTVRVVFKDGEEKKFESRKECGEYFNVSTATITYWIQGKRKGFRQKGIVKIEFE